jgi:hypothetical protein
VIEIPPPPPGPDIATDLHVCPDFGREHDATLKCWCRPYVATAREVEKMLLRTGASARRCAATAANPPARVVVHRVPN